MREILYAEVPTPNTVAVKNWLQQKFESGPAKKVITPDGIRLEFPIRPIAPDISSPLPLALSFVVWSLQRTTYLKAFRWADKPLPQEQQLLNQLTTGIRKQFPLHYPEPPDIDLTQQPVFEALQAYYPKTVQYFQRMPNGEADLARVYWWEQRWRESVKNPQAPKQVIFRRGERRETGDKGQETGDRSRGVGEQGEQGRRKSKIQNPKSEIPNGAERSLSGAMPDQAIAPRAINPESLTSDFYDLIYIGGALGVIHAAVMANLGYKVLLVERLSFGRMNREWNISRAEFQCLIDLGLFTPKEFESLIAREYTDGFNKFFDANNPPFAKAPVLHTPTVLNIAIDSEQLLRACGEKLLAVGGMIQDETEFQWAEISDDRVEVQIQHRQTQAQQLVSGRLLVDAMGTASPIAWQLNGGRTFDSVCPTVGASISSGFAPGVWNSQWGDVLYSHGDISKGRQLIWELFPGRGDELTIYLFHYHQVHPDNPGSLLEMYEDFFNILPEYRRCNLDELTWRKPTFGYIPGHFSVLNSDRNVAFDRLVSIGDAASLQSPLIFTGFGSLVRNLPRLTELLHIALRHNLLKAKHLNQIRAFQSNVAVTWLFSKGMMAPTGKWIPPARINAMLNTFFGVLEQESPAIAESFIKDRCSWLAFNSMALKAAWKNPSLLLWIWQLAGFKDILRWIGSYLNYTVISLLSWLLGWLPIWLKWSRGWLEPLNPALWFWLITRSYMLTYGIGRPPTPEILLEPVEVIVNASKKQPFIPSSSAPRSPAAPKGPEP